MLDLTSTASVVRSRVGGLHLIPDSRLVRVISDIAEDYQSKGATISLDALCKELEGEVAIRGELLAVRRG